MHRETYKWSCARERPVHLWCDARSTPPRVSAVLVKNGHIKFCDAEPPRTLLDKFLVGRDKQITTLELLAIAYGKCRHIA